MTNKIFYAVVILIFSLTACAPVKPIQFRSLSEFKVQNLTSSPEISVNLNLHNPNSVGGKVKDFHLNFFMSNIEIASLQMEKVRIPSRGDFTLPLSTTTTYQQIITFLPSGLSSLNKGLEIPVRLKGSVTFKKFIFRKTIPFEFHDSINAKEIKTN